MPVSVQRVTSPRTDRKRLPDELVPGAQLLIEMAEDGLLEPVATSLQLARRGGHTAVGLFAFAALFLMAGPTGGIRPFWQRTKNALPRVAAALDLKALPSSGAVSRACRKLDEPTVQHFTDHTLTCMPGFARLMQHPATAHLDAHGQAWHVCDLDPSVHPFRQRALDLTQDAPEPERLAPGAPGYTGQYRGELRMRHLPMLHAGAGVWLAYQLLDDNEDRLSDRAASLTRQAKQQLLAAQRDPDRILVRADTEFGAAGIAGAIIEQGVHLLTRIARYHLLDSEQGQQALAQRGWQPVISSTGRQREALELGTFTLAPSSDSKDADREPVTLRVVACRRPWQGPAPYGVVRDGFLYELFATTLPPEAWPAAAVVSLYAGRATMENHLAQEDRELGLGRTFSYAAAGQQWMVSVGLYLWNRMTIAGFLADPPAEAAVAASRGAVVEAAAAPTSVSAQAEGAQPAARQVDAAALAEVLSARFSSLGQGWALQAAEARLECPGGRSLRVRRITVQGRRRQRRVLVFEGAMGSCDGCPLRRGCTEIGPGVRRTVSRTVSKQESAVASQWLSQPSAAPPSSTSTPRGPVFLAAAARQRTRTRLSSSIIEVSLGRWCRVARHGLVAGPEEGTVRGRRTWSQRLDRWRIGRHVRVRIQQLPA